MLINSITLDIIVNILGGISMLIFIITAYVKNKNKMLSYQCGAHILFIVTEFLTNAWSSIVQELVSITRNLSVIFKKNTKILNIVLIVLGVVLGVSANIIGKAEGDPWYGSLIGYLPVIANLEFSLVVMKKDVSVKSIKLAFSISSLLWAINFMVLGVYISAILNGVTCITALITFIKLSIKKENKEEIKENLE